MEAEMLKRLNRLALAIVILLLIIPFSSCRPELVAPDDAVVIILQPSAGSTLSSGSINVRTYVENINLVDKAGQANIVGEGHLVFYLDVTPPLVSAQPGITTEGTYIASAEKSYTWENVSPGQHSFWVQLVNNDNTVLEPPAAVRVPVTVVGN
jgi:hypothetical protein